MHQKNSAGDCAPHATWGASQTSYRLI